MNTAPHDRIKLARLTATNPKIAYGCIMSEDVFDRLDDYDVDVPPAEKSRKKAPVQVLRRKPFGSLTLEAAKQLGGRVCVIVHISHHMALGKDKPVPATALRTGCNNRRVRLKTLRTMESLGLAEIEWRGNGRAPLIKRWDVGPRPSGIDRSRSRIAGKEKWAPVATKFRGGLL